MVESSTHGHGFELRLEFLPMWLDEDLNQGLVVQESDEFPKTRERVFGLLEEGQDESDGAEVRVLGEVRELGFGLFGEVEGDIHLCKISGNILCEDYNNNSKDLDR